MCDCSFLASIAKRFFYRDRILYMMLPIIHPIIAVRIKLKVVGSGWYPVLDDISKNNSSNFVNSF